MSTCLTTALVSGKNLWRINPADSTCQVMWFEPPLTTLPGGVTAFYSPNTPVTAGGVTTPPQATTVAPASHLRWCDVSCSWWTGQPGTLRVQLLLLHYGCLCGHHHGLFRPTEVWSSHWNVRMGLQYPCLSMKAENILVVEMPQLNMTCFNMSWLVK